MLEIWLFYREKFLFLKAAAEIDIKKVDKDKLESIEKELSIHLLDMIYMGMDKEEILKLVESLYDKVKH